MMSNGVGDLWAWAFDDEEPDGVPPWEEPERWYESLADDLGRGDWRDDEEWWGPERSFRSGGGDLGRLTQITVIRGHVVDVQTRPVSGSGYECAALELGAGAPPVAPLPPPPPLPAAHEQQLAWLEWVAGGAKQLAALHDRPLSSGPEDVAYALGDPRPESLVGRSAGDRLTVMARRIREVGPAHLGVEGTLVACRILERVVASRPSLLGVLTDDVAAASALIAAGRGNGLVGQGRATSAKALGEACGLTTAPTQRARSFADAVAGATVSWPRDMGYGRGPDVFLLRLPDLLISEFRRELIGLRTIALALRESADRQHRAAG